MTILSRPQYIKCVIYEICIHGTDAICTDTPFIEIWCDRRPPGDDILEIIVLNNGSASVVKIMSKECDVYIEW